MPLVKARAFFFNDTATTEIYTLSLHDALPISESQKLELDMLLNGNNEIKARVMKGLKIKDLSEIKYVNFEIIKKRIVALLENEKKEEINDE